MLMNQNEKFLFGYVNGECYTIQNTPEQIAAFIVKYREYDVMITSILDITLITTIHGFLDYVADQVYLQTKLLPVLVPMQKGEVHHEFVEYEVMNEEILVSQHDGVKLEGTVMNIVITRNPIDDEIPFIMHILDLAEEADITVNEAINREWCELLLNKLGLQKNVESYEYYCYGTSGVMKQFHLNCDEKYRFSELSPEQIEIWPAFREIMLKRF